MDYSTDSLPILAPLLGWLATVSDSVDGLGTFDLRGFDLLPALAAEDADETPHSVHPACGGYVPGQGRTPGTLDCLGPFDSGCRYASAWHIYWRFLRVDGVAAQAVSPRPGCDGHIDHSGSEKLQVQFERARGESARESFCPARFKGLRSVGPKLSSPYLNRRFPVGGNI